MNKILPFLALSLLATTSFAAEIIHTVSEGETMSHIVKRYNISSEDIKAANDKKTDVVWVGMKLTIPTSGSNSAQNTPATKEQSVKSLSSEKTPSAEVVHVFKEGDTMWSVAKQYGVSTADIKAANDKKTDVVWVGMKLKIPNNSSTSSNIETKEEHKVNKATAEPSDNKSNIIHTVSEGETMSHIVKRYNISSEDIKAANDKKTDVVWVGMKLTIPVNGVGLADSQKVEQKQQAKPEVEKSVENQSPIYPSSSRVYKKVQHGVEFKHQGSDEVKACLGGTVTAIVNTIENLKPLVILKHGKRTTIYGKLSSISVKQGDVVEQGAKIGTFGKEGLYFSAREDGEFVDPAEFLVS